MDVTTIHSVLGEIKVALIKAIQKYANGSRINVSGDCIYITDEEELTREEIESVDSENVYFYNGTNLNYDNLGTDDLVSVYEALRDRSE